MKEMVRRSLLMETGETAEFLEMTDGFRLSVRHWKPARRAERAIACIHGFGGHAGGFRALGETLAANEIDVYGLDLRGFGNSKEKDLPRGDVKDFNRHIQDLGEAVTLIREISQCGKVYVFGQSLGALYALWFGAKHPEMATGLILAAPALMVKSRISEETRAKFPVLLANSPGTMIETTGPLYLAGKFHSDLLRTTRFSVRYCFSVASVLMGENAFRYAGTINVSTLILQGEADEEAKPSGAEQLFRAIAAKDKTLTMLPGVDHFMWGSKEKVCPAIIDWLKTH